MVSAQLVSKIECTPIWPPPEYLSGPAASIAFLKGVLWAVCMEHHLVGCPDKSVQAYSIFPGVLVVLSKAKLRGLGTQIYNKVLGGVKLKRKVDVHQSLKPQITTEKRDWKQPYAKLQQMRVTVYLCTFRGLLVVSKQLRIEAYTDQITLASTRRFSHSQRQLL